MNVLISGGTGLVGSRLANLLISEGHQVRILSRAKTNIDRQIFHWDYKKGILDEDALIDLDVVVHLAGTSVADGRWTKNRKKDILDSRVKTAELIFQKINKRGQTLPTYISASGTGFYGNRPNEQLSETSSKGSGFLTDVCDQWEKSASNFAQLGAKIYVNRIGIVLSTEGGYIGKMKELFRFGLGAELGSGKQIMSWIHIDDLVRIVSYQIDNKLDPGTYNSVAPQRLSHHDLMRQLAKKLGRKIWLPNVPKFALKILFGELSVELTASQDAYPERLINQKFPYQYNELTVALDNLL